MPSLYLSSPKVVAEVIDGEAIILDLRAGVYFATEGVGATVWAAAADGVAIEEIGASASQFYPGHPDAREQVLALLDEFVRAGLLATDDTAEGSVNVSIDWPLVYTAPALEKHDDLQDMMQLDPIHDTDASGWPAPAPTPRR